MHRITFTEPYAREDEYTHFSGPNTIRFDDMNPWALAAEEGFLRRACYLQDEITTQFEGCDAYLENGLSVDVKCRSQESGDDLAVPQADYESGSENADVYVLCWHLGDIDDDVGRFEYVGWASRSVLEHANQDDWWVPGRGYQTTMWVPHEHLCGQGLLPATWREQMNLHAKKIGRVQS